MLVIFAAVSALVTQPSPKDLRDCVGASVLAADMPAIAAQRAAGGEAAWQDACRQARDATDRRRSLQRVILETAASPMEGYGPTLAFARARKATTEPDKAELLRRATVDSVLRTSLSWVSPRGPAQGLSPLAKQLYDGVAGNEAIASDMDNRRWLGDAVKRRGWFTISRDGAEANYAASLIVQHADFDLPFKREMLTLLEPLALNGDTTKPFFTQAYDRWAAAAHEPQRFGLQGACKAKGVWEPLPIENPDQIDERRRQFGLKQPFATYVAQMGARCP